MPEPPSTRISRGCATCSGPAARRSRRPPCGTVRDFALEDDLDRLPGELAYGRRRLVGIARAVASAPSVLLLDEPAAGLDENETTELGNLVRRLAHDRGMAVLLIEHDVSLVLRICDRIVVLDFGTQDRRRHAVGDPPRPGRGRGVSR